MDRHVPASSFERLSGSSRAMALGGILLLSAALLWTITVAPLVVGSAVTIGLAAAWCRWLEHHPEAPVNTTGGAAEDRERSGLIARRTTASR